jgi:hypothetical protein
MPHESVRLYGQHERFEDFNVQVDGKGVSYETECRAFKLTPAGRPGPEVTSELKRLGLSVCHFEGLKTEKQISSLSARIIEGATHAGLLSRDPSDEELLPNYSLQRRHSWNQFFPAGKRVRISHHYKPALGMNSVMLPEYDWKGLMLPWAVGDLSGISCLFSKNNPSSPATESCLKQAQSEGLGEGTFFARQLDYILTPANRWKDGVQKFRLKITGAKVILVEIDGIQDFDLGSYETQRKNFRPTKELKLEFLGDARAPFRAHSKLGLNKEIDGPAHCRTEPNAQDGRILASIGDKERVLILERREAWYRIRYQELECWTHRRNLRFR